MNKLKILRLEPFVLMILAVVLFASVLPAEGLAATVLHNVMIAAIVLLFFMHGAKLSTQAIVSGVLHWRLHLVVLTATFLFFPLMGWLLMLMPTSILSPSIMAGVLYLCAMPSTVQSSIAFTSSAGGNVSAAVCSASLSSLLGVFISPLIVLVMMKQESDFSHQIGKTILDIVLTLLVPFVLGHMARPWIGRWIDRHKKWIKITDHSSILLIVYSAFSAAVLDKLWGKVDAWDLVVIVFVCLLLLFSSLLFTTYIAKLFKFKREDQITIVFCGSKKSLASGVPMANILFPVATVGLMILPLMIFHQIQLIVCSFIAAHYAKKSASLDETIEHTHSKKEKSKLK